MSDETTTTHPENPETIEQGLPVEPVHDAEAVREQIASTGWEDRIAALEADVASLKITCNSLMNALTGAGRQRLITDGIAPYGNVEATGPTPST